MPEQTPHPATPINLEQIRVQHTGVLLFYVSFFIFFLALAGYGGLFFLNRNQNATKQELLGQIEEKSSALSSDRIQQIYGLEQRLKTISVILGRHPFPTRSLTWLEEKTYPEIAYSSFSFNQDTRRLELAGTARSLTALNKQVALLEKDPVLESIDFGGIALERGGSVGFKVTAIFKPSFLQLGIKNP
ncbi:MAG: hypothetical protein HY006_02585 [Candidatus Sungbacteria bacterium]|nr:hypothetical protein [Candidatus Sungbacteria bacterium]